MRAACGFLAPLLLLSACASAPGADDRPVAVLVAPPRAGVEAGAAIEPGVVPALLRLVDPATPLADSTRLDSLLALDWAYTVQEYPETGTWAGQPAEHGRWTDASLAAVTRREGEQGLFLAALDVIDRDALDDARRLDYDLYRTNVELGIALAPFPDELLPITQMGGVQTGPAELLEMMPATRVAQYEDMLSRLRSVDVLVDQTIARMRAGLARGITPPRITLRDVPAQAAAMITEDPFASPLLAPFTRMPETIPSSDRERLRREADDAYRSIVRPAYERLHRFLAEEYVPGARASIGVSALPDGAAWYRLLARSYTTTTLTPAEIHQIGEREVARIRAEMEAIRSQVGFQGTLAQFFEHLRTDPRFFHTDGEALLTGYRDIAKRADAALPALFGTLPRLPYGVREIPAHSAPSQTTAYYNTGSLDTGRPAWFYANTYNLASRPKWEMVALTLHEAVPGHHLQLALQQEQNELPMFRRFGGYTAFVEGWGLYAESLGYEMGMYDDPYDRFGQLTYDMWRAVRLVVDTGIHSMGWSRQQAIDFFAANSSKPLHDITVEIDRYVVWPGQALAYKIGQLRIRELRTYAEQELGPDFDVRAFHDVVLGAGSVTLDVLERRVREWVSARLLRRTPPPASPTTTSRRP